MKKIIFYIEILTNGDNLEEYFFETAKNNFIDLGKGIIIFKESCNNSYLKMRIEINKEEIISYNDLLTTTLLSNIIASWLVYKLTGKKINLLIDNHEVPLKKHYLKNYIEKILGNYY